MDDQDANYLLTNALLASDQNSRVFHIGGQGVGTHMPVHHGRASLQR